MLQVVIFLCAMASQECGESTATVRYTILVESQTPVGCIIKGYEELAKMSSYDPATQKAVLSCGRRR